MKITDFIIEYLGVEEPCYFKGYGLGSDSRYNQCCYGSGYTEQDALNNAFDIMASYGIEIPDELEDELDNLDDKLTVNDYLGEQNSDALFYVGIKYNTREDKIKKLVKEFYHGNVPEGDNIISYGAFTRTNRCDDSYFFLPYASGSDYSGSTVELSNHNEFLEQFGEQNFVYDVYGDYGTYAVVIGVKGLLECNDETFNEIIEILERLEDYPLISEEAHSLLEMDLENKTWEDWAEWEFRQAIDKKFDIEIKEDDDIIELFEWAREKSNTYWYNESADNMIIDIDRIVDSIDEGDISCWLNN